MSWIKENYQWAFSGIGVSSLVLIYGIIQRWRVILGPIRKLKRGIKLIVSGLKEAQSEGTKEGTRILFIDDDTKFKVVTILKKSGWVNTRLVKDIDNLDDPGLKEINLFFVDIQGVGVSLNFKDEGLGLALALKTKYPKSKVIIYSAETKGERFHQALRKADDFLPKNAEPYEFQNLVEQYSKLLKDER